jgi:antitoxin FitA
MPAMPSWLAWGVLTIRQLDQKTKTRLRVRAVHHGRSMEEGAREILRSVLTASPPSNGNLAKRIRRRFAPLGRIELSLPRRDAVRKPLRSLEPAARFPNQGL